MATRFSNAVKVARDNATGVAHLPPPKLRLAREFAVFANVASGRLAINRLARDFAARCDGRPVMLVPGFLASPQSMYVLAETLRRTGYDVSDWGLGRNLGARADTLTLLAERVARERSRHGRAVTLIGWSLGGVFARELAKLHPELVAEVLTLGSPFSGSPRANNAWRIYERVAGHPVDAPPVPVVRGTKPPVPTTAFWSPRDGVIAPASARGHPHERDKAVELDCGHLGFASKPSALQAVLDHLAIRYSGAATERAAA